MRIAFLFIPATLEDVDPSSVVVMIGAVTIIGCSVAVLCFLPVECVWAKGQRRNEGAGESENFLMPPF